MIYVTFPHEFIAVPRHPGYYYNIKNKTLYSIKVDGVLKPLKKHKESKFNRYRSGWVVSRNGHKWYIEEGYLNSLIPVASTVPCKLESDSRIPVNQRKGVIDETCKR